MTDETPIRTPLDDQMDRLDRQRAAHAGLPRRTLDSLAGRLRVELTYSSNAIEGNTLSLRETQLVVEEGILPGNSRTLREVYEARNHFEAVQACPYALPVPSPLPPAPPERSAAFAPVQNTLGVPRPAYGILRGLLAILGLLASLSAGQAADAPRYNVLLVIADDLRPALGCYGDRQARTPNIDRLASRGVRFDRAYVQYPVCNPSRTSLLTGIRPERSGVVGNGTFFRQRLPDVVTLPQLFRQHGATALSYGKIYHAGLVEGEVIDSMLDVGKSWDEARMFRPTELGSTGRRRNLTGDKLRWCEIGDMEGGDNDQSDGQTAAQTVAAMERLRRQRWFIGAGFHRPHDPFVVAKRYVEQFPPGSLRLHSDPPDASPLLPLSLGGGAFAEAFAKFDDRDRMDFLTHYYAGTTQTDAQVGRLLEALDRLKLWDSTVVIFIGDHGYHLGERGWWNKNTLFDRSCRAPLIVAAPGVKPGVCRSLVEFLDLYPTIAGLCGLGFPTTVEGRSLQSLLKDPSQSVRDSAVTHAVRGNEVAGYSLRTDRWRYTEWNGGRDGIELYDHHNDPGEWHNLAARPELAGERIRLAARLRGRLESRP